MIFWSSTQLPTIREATVTRDRTVLPPQFGILSMYRCVLSYLAANDENSAREWGREKVDHLLMKPRWTFASFVHLIFFFFFFIVQIGRPVEREREKKRQHFLLCRRFVSNGWKSDKSFYFYGHRARILYENLSRYNIQHYIASETQCQSRTTLLMTIASRPFF